jgi:hypothetical protein
MSDYGLKVSKLGKDATSSNDLDIIMSTKYPFAKIDPTKTDTFRTTTILFTKNTTKAVDTLIYQFDHGYTYTPQVWGLWSIIWGPGVVGVAGSTYNGYGTVSSSSGIPVATLHYKVGMSRIELYAIWSDPLNLAPIDLSGTIATLTTYVFADDLTTQTY